MIFYRKTLSVKTIEILPTEHQNEILELWLKAYTEMYNSALTFIRNKYKFIVYTVAMKTILNNNINKNDKNIKIFIILGAN